MVKYIVLVVYIICVFAFFIYLVNRKFPTSRHNAKKYREHFEPVEFKPMDNLTLEEYIILCPKTPTRATQAILVELNRQGKISIEAQENPTPHKQELLVVTKKPDKLTDPECGLLAAIKEFQPKSRNEELKKFLWSTLLEVGISLLLTVILRTEVDLVSGSSVRERTLSKEQIKAVKSTATPWTTRLRANAIFETNPMRYFLPTKEIVESLQKKGFISKEEESKKAKFISDWIIVLPIVLIFVPMLIVEKVTSINFGFTKSTSVAQGAIIGFLAFLLPFAFGVVLKYRLDAITQYRKYTEKGICALHYYLGLERYLKHVEEKSINESNLNKAKISEITPYAILFGLEKKWNKKLHFVLYES